MKCLNIFNVVVVDGARCRCRIFFSDICPQGYQNHHPQTYKFTIEVIKSHAKV